METAGYILLLLAADHHIGPGQTYPTLGAATAVMQDDDTLLIHPGTYAEQLVIDRNNITVKGVDGRPVILGTKATIPAHSAVSYKPLETFGLVRVGPTARSNIIPHDITLENLEVRGANSDQADKSITLSDGKPAEWNDFACGFYLLTFDRVTIRNCKVTDNGNGIFSHDGHHCADLLIEKCEVFGNGKIGSFSDHNLYVQCIRPIYRNNVFGRTRPGSGGGNLKDRSADPLIEGNLILAGARQIDLSEWQGDNTIEIQGTENSSRVRIRNNTLVNLDGDAISVNYLAYRYDSNGRAMHVEYDNNTVVINRNAWYENLFQSDDSNNDVQFRRNILYVTAPNLAATPGIPELRVMNTGLLTFADNWALANNLSEYAWMSAPVVKGKDTFQFGEPGFVDFAKGDYRLKDDAPAKGYGAQGTPPVVTPPPPPPPPPVDSTIQFRVRTLPDGGREIYAPIP